MFRRHGKHRKLDIKRKMTRENHYKKCTLYGISSSLRDIHHGISPSYPANMCTVNIFWLRFGSGFYRLNYEMKLVLASIFIYYFENIINDSSYMSYVSMTIDHRLIFVDKGRKMFLDNFDLKCCL